MGEIKVSKIASVFEAWPAVARGKLHDLRELILKTALAEDVGVIEETLKWGEPAYLCKSGSTIRLGYKASDPQHYHMYFNCQSKLIETFREVYTDEFVFDGNRARVFSLDDEVPVEALSHCIRVALRYHQCKSQPLLGM